MFSQVQFDALVANAKQLRRDLSAHGNPIKVGVQITVDYSGQRRVERVVAKLKDEIAHYVRDPDYKMHADGVPRDNCHVCAARKEFVRVMNRRIHEFGEEYEDRAAVADPELDAYYARLARLPSPTSEMLSPNERRHEFSPVAAGARAAGNPRSTGSGPVRTTTTIPRRPDLKGHSWDSASDGSYPPRRGVQPGSWALASDDDDAEVAPAATPTVLNTLYTVGEQAILTQRPVSGIMQGAWFTMAQRGQHLRDECRRWAMFMHGRMNMTALYDVSSVISPLCGTTAIMLALGPYTAATATAAAAGAVAGGLRGASAYVPLENMYRWCLQYHRTAAYARKLMRGLRRPVPCGCASALGATYSADHAGLTLLRSVTEGLFGPLAVAADPSRIAETCTNILFVLASQKIGSRGHSALKLLLSGCRALGLPREFTPTAMKGDTIRDIFNRLSQANVDLLLLELTARELAVVSTFVQGFVMIEESMDQCSQERLNYLNELVRHVNALDGARAVTCRHCTVMRSVYVSLVVAVIISRWALRGQGVSDWIADHFLPVYLEPCGLDSASAVFDIVGPAQRARCVLVSNNKKKYLATVLDIFGKHVPTAKTWGQYQELTVEGMGKSVALHFAESQARSIVKSGCTAENGVALGTMMIELSQQQQSVLITHFGAPCEPEGRGGKWCYARMADRTKVRGNFEFSYVKPRGANFVVMYDKCFKYESNEKKRDHSFSDLGLVPGDCGVPLLGNGGVFALFIARGRSIPASHFCELELPKPAKPPAPKEKVEACGKPIDPTDFIQKGTKLIEDYLTVDMTKLACVDPLLLDMGHGMVYPKPTPLNAAIGVAQSATIPDNETPLAAELGARVTKMLADVETDAKALGYVKTAHRDGQDYWQLLEGNATASGLDSRLQTMIRDIVPKLKIPESYREMFRQAHETPSVWAPVIKRFNEEAGHLAAYIDKKPGTQHPGIIAALTVFSKDEPCKAGKLADHAMRAIISPGPWWTAVLARWAYERQPTAAEKAAGSRIIRCTLDAVLAALTKVNAKYEWYVGGLTRPQIAARLDRLEDPVSFDFKTWDKTIPAAAMRALYGGVYSPKAAERITECLGTDMQFLFRGVPARFGGKKGVKKTLWPSGNPLTFSGNSLINWSLQCLVHGEAVRGLVAGDDVIISRTTSSVARTVQDWDPVRDPVYAPFGFIVKVVDDKPQFTQLKWRATGCDRVDVERIIERQLAHPTKMRNVVHAQVTGSALGTELAQLVPDDAELKKAIRLAEDCYARTLPEITDNKETLRSYRHGLRKGVAEPVLTGQRFIHVVGKAEPETETVEACGIPHSRETHAAAVGFITGSAATGVAMWYILSRVSAAAQRVRTEQAAVYARLLDRMESDVSSARNRVAVALARAHEHRARADAASVSYAELRGRHEALTEAYINQCETASECYIGPNGESPATVEADTATQLGWESRPSTPSTVCPDLPLDAFRVEPFGWAVEQLALQAQLAGGDDWQPTPTPPIPLQRQDAFYYHPGDIGARAMAAAAAIRDDERLLLGGGFPAEPFDGQYQEDIRWTDVTGWEGAAPQPRRRGRRGGRRHRRPQVTQDDDGAAVAEPETTELDGQRPGESREEFRARMRPERRRWRREMQRGYERDIYGSHTDDDDVVEPCGMPVAAREPRNVGYDRQAGFDYAADHEKSAREAAEAELDGDYLHPADHAPGRTLEWTDDDLDSEQAQAEADAELDEDRDNEVRGPKFINLDTDDDDDRPPRQAYNEYVDFEDGDDIYIDSSDGEVYDHGRRVTGVQASAGRALVKKYGGKRR